jgi:hypothetical protein
MGYFNKWNDLSPNNLSRLHYDRIASSESLLRYLLHTTLEIGKIIINFNRQPGTNM